MNELHTFLRLAATRSIVALAAGYALAVLCAAALISWQSGFAAAGTASLVNAGLTVVPIGLAWLAGKVTERVAPGGAWWLLRLLAYGISQLLLFAGVFAVVARFGGMPRLALNSDATPPEPDTLPMAALFAGIVVAANTLPLVFALIVEAFARRWTVRNPLAT